MANDSPLRAPERLLGLLFRQGSSRSFRALRRDRLAMMSLVFLVAIILAAILAPWLTPYAAQGSGEPNIIEKFEPPGATHPLGTDQLGRDVLARILFGSRTSLLAAFSIVFLALGFGTILGAIAGYLGAGSTRSSCQLPTSFWPFHRYY